MAVMKKKMAGTSALCAKLKASRANARVAISNPLSVLRSSEKVGRSALLVQLRCNTCHGLTVREVMAAMAQKGATYKMADLKYDIMNGRLEVLKPGSKASLARGQGSSRLPVFRSAIARRDIGRVFSVLAVPAAHAIPRTHWK